MPTRSRSSWPCGSAMWWWRPLCGGGTRPTTRGFPGTISLRPDVYLGLLQDVLPTAFSRTGSGSSSSSTGTVGTGTSSGGEVFRGAWCEPACRSRPRVFWDMAIERIREIRESRRGAWPTPANSRPRPARVQPALVKMELASSRWWIPAVGMAPSMSFKDLMDFGAVTTGCDLTRSGSDRDRSGIPRSRRREGAADRGGGLGRDLPVHQRSTAARNARAGQTAAGGAQGLC